MRKDLVGTTHIVSELALTIARLEERLSRRSQEDQGDCTTRPQWGRRLADDRVTVCPVGDQLAHRIPQQTQPHQAPTRLRGGHREHPTCPFCQMRHWGICRRLARTCHTYGELGHRAAAYPRQPLQHYVPHATRFQEYPVCSTCQKHHMGTCLIGTKLCFHCGEPGHRIRECPGHVSQQQGQARPVQ